MLKDIDAVIFDMDGTLVDSMWVWEKIDIEYMNARGYEIPDDFHKSIEGMSFTETAIYVKDRFNIEDDLDTIIEDWHDRVRSSYESEIMMKEGALDFMKKLKEQGIKMGIGSSNSKELISVIVEKYGLGEYISAITTSCEVGSGKPAPDVYLESAKRLGVDSSRCLVFEDVPNGIRAANNAGMRSCAIYDNFSSDYDDEKRDLADYYIEDYTQLL